jgi:hypothetical protein
LVALTAGAVAVEVLSCVLLLLAGPSGELTAPCARATAVYPLTIENRVARYNKVRRRGEESGDPLL